MKHLLYLVWDPSLGIPIGSFTLRVYSLMYVAAFLIGYQIIKKIYRIENIDEKTLDPLFLYMFIAIIFGARLGHVLFYDWELFLIDPISVFLPFQVYPKFEFTGFQGLASHGAAIGIVIALYLYNRKYLKKNLLWIFDRIGIVVAIGGMFIRIGNFWNSEIVGKPFNGTIAVKFLQQSASYGPIVPRHPSQLYEAFGYLLLFLFLVYLYFKTSIKQKLGSLFSIFLIVLFGIRFIVEFYKEPQGEESIQFFGLNTGQCLSVPFIVSGVLLFIYSNFKKKVS